MADVWRWWPQSLQETLEFETDVRMARSAEWRDSLKDATQYLSLGHLMPVAEAEAAIEVVRTNTDGEWLVPEWPNATIFTGTIAAAEDTVSVEVPTAYTVGQQVFIGTGPNAWEQGEVAAVDIGSITLVDGLVGYVGSSNQPVVVVPMQLCIAPGGIEFQTGFGAQGMSIRFMAIEPVDLSENPYPTHSGLPVVIDGRVPFQPLNGSLNQAVDVFSSRHGAYALQQVETYTRRRGTVSWYDKSHTGRWERRKFLHFLRGRDGAFWLPTDQRDLPLVEQIDAADLTITVAPFAASAEMVGRRIVIREGA